MQKSILVQGSSSTANFIYYKCKVWSYRLVSKAVTGNVGMMVDTNQIKRMREATRKIRSRCNMNSVQRLYKPIDGAALRLSGLCAGQNRGRARGKGVA